MIHAFDHVGLRVEDPGGATTAYETLLGRSPVWRYAEGGPRVRFQLSNMALEIVGAGEPSDPNTSLWNLAFAVEDLPRARWLLERRGAPCLSAGAEREHAVVAFNATHGVAIALAQRSRSASPRLVFEDDTVHALDHVVIHTANPDRAIAFYGARLGLDFRLDRSNPQWGSRLLFFRCGDAVVEIAADLAAPAADHPDRITGLAWRVGDPVAAQARLAAGGLDVSPVRQGRKPGTQVFTVRSGVPGAPTLMIGGAGVS